MGRWEEVDDIHTLNADIVISAFVLPLVPDARPFLRKLDAATRRHAFLYLSAYSADAVLDPLWRHFHESPRQPGPTYLDAVAVLRELGITPDVRVVEVANRLRFPTMSAAIVEYRELLLLPDDDETTRELGSLLGTWLIKQAGALRPPFSRVSAAIVHWGPGRAPH